MFLRRVIQEPMKLNTARQEVETQTWGGSRGLSKVGDGPQADEPRSQKHSPGGLRRNSSIILLGESKRVGCVGNDGLQMLGQAWRPRCG